LAPHGFSRRSRVGEPVVAGLGLVVAGSAAAAGGYES